MNLFSYVYVESFPYLKFGFGWMYFLVHFTMLRPMKLYHVFIVFVWHLLYCSSNITSLNYCNRIIIMFWILENSCMQDGLTWSNSMNLHCRNMKYAKQRIYIGWSNGIRFWKNCLFVQLNHGVEELHRPLLVLTTKMLKHMCQSS